MACDPNTLLQNGRLFQSLSERDREIVIAQLLCEISQNSSGGGSIQFGDPTGPNPLIPGKMAYDALGNVWVDTDPAGAHDWQILIAGPQGRAVSPAQMEIAPMAAPGAPPMPPVSIPVSKRLQKVWQYLGVWVIFFIP